MFKFCQTMKIVVPIMLKKTYGFSIIVNISKYFNLGLRLTGSTNNDKYDSSKRSTYWNNKLSYNGINVSNSTSRLNYQQSSGWIKTKESPIFKNKCKMSTNNYNIRRSKRSQVIVYVGNIVLNMF